MTSPRPHGHPLPMIDLTDDECRAMISEGGVPEPIRGRSSRVAVVLTQSWCPDWRVMRNYLSRLDEPGLTVFAVEYDQRPIFRELMAFKETVFGNHEIPYVRHYRDGRLVGESNLVFTSRGFLGKFRDG